MATIAVRYADGSNDEIPPQIDLGHWWIAFYANEPVGYAGYARAQSNPGMAYLYRAGVLPGFRGRGLQRRLVRAREAHARRRGYLGFVTDTTLNIASANNLIRSGFTLYAPAYPWAFSYSLYWRKVF